MAIIKVASSIFSTVRTITKALKIAKAGDVIHLANGTYDETLEIEGSVTIEGSHKQQTVFTGTLIIMRNAQIILENMTLHPSATIVVKGNAFFNNCDISTTSLSTLVTVFGTLETKNCTVFGAKEVGLELRPNAQLLMDRSHLHTNGKVHILADHANIELFYCTLHEANHAVWLKNDSLLNLKKCRIHDHTGTQLIAHQQSSIFDQGSKIWRGNGNGIYASNQAEVTLIGSQISEHTLPQVWMQHAHLKVRNTLIAHGKESGIMLRDHASAEIFDAEFAHHTLAHLQVTLSSHAHIATTQMTNSRGNAIQLKDHATVNMIESKISESYLAQCHVSEKSVLHLYDSTIDHGIQNGIFCERKSAVYLIQSRVSFHKSSAISAVDAAVELLSSDVFHNSGNAVLLMNHASVYADDCRFSQNAMPHFAGKSRASIHIRYSELADGKSIYALEDSLVKIEHCHIHTSNGIQLEIRERTKMTIFHSKIAAGQSNGIKVSESSFLEMVHSEISDHRLPQLVVDDSQLILRHCEVHSGYENGLLLENEAEALIEDTFLSKHRFPQLWVNDHSSVELRTVHFTEAMEADIYVSQHSSIDLHKCYIYNERVAQNIQALHHSTIELHDSITRTTRGEAFYIENNSSITKDVEEH